MALDLPSYLLGKSKGGGGGGTSDYSQLSNKPSINGITLSGNKTSADLGLQNTTQYSTMPTASADNVGQIVQYIGTTDANYTNGYFYICVSDNSSYSWNNLNVQGSGSSSAGLTYLGDISQYSTQQTALDISNLEKGFYYFTTTEYWLSTAGSKTIYLIVNGTTKEVKLNNAGGSPTLGMWTLQIINKASNVGSTYPYRIARIFSSWIGNVTKDIGNEVNTIYYAANNMIIAEDDTRKIEKIMTLNTAETVTAKKTFNVLPESSEVPTTDNQLVNKKYVDDIVGDISTVLATLTTPGGE